jgi:hypothetical protein
MATGYFRNSFLQDLAVANYDDNIIILLHVKEKNKYHRDLNQRKNIYSIPRSKTPAKKRSDPRIYEDFVEAVFLRKLTGLFPACSWRITPEPPRNIPDIFPKIPAKNRIPVTPTETIGPY